MDAPNYQTFQAYALCTLIHAKTFRFCQEGKDTSPEGIDLPYQAVLKINAPSFQELQCIVILPHEQSHMDSSLQG